MGLPFLVSTLASVAACGPKAWPRPPFEDVLARGASSSSMLA